MSHDPMFENGNANQNAGDFRGPGFSGGYPNVEPPQFPNPNQGPQPDWAQPNGGFYDQRQAPPIDQRQARIMGVGTPVPPKKSRKGKVILGILAGLALLFTAVAIGGGGDDTEAAKTTATQVVQSESQWSAPTTTWSAPRLAPALPVAPAPVSGYPQNKLLTIGKDIQPGTYDYVVPEDTIMAGFVYTCTTGSDCNSAMTADSSDMFSVGESGQYVVPASGYIKLDDVLLTPVS